MDVFISAQPWGRVHVTSIAFFALHYFRMKLDPVEFVHPVEVSHNLCPLLLAALFVLSTLRLPLIPQLWKFLSPTGRDVKINTFFHLTSSFVLVSILFGRGRCQEILLLWRLCSFPCVIWSVVIRTG